MKYKMLAILALLLVQMFYGVTFTFANEVIDGGYILPFGFIVLRVFFAGILFWLFDSIIKTRKIEGKDFPKLITAALFGVTLNMLAFFKGLQFTAPINASVIMITVPIIVLILSSIILSEKITTMKVMGIAFGIIGALILTINGQQNNSGENIILGNSLIFINAVSYSFYLILIKKLTAKYHPFDFMKWLFLFGSIMVLPFGVNELRMVQWNLIPNYIWFYTIFVIVFATFFVHLFNSLALVVLKASTVSTFLYLQPVFAALFAVTMGSDKVDSIKFISAVLIFIGVYLVTKNNTFDHRGLQNNQRR